MTDMQMRPATRDDLDALVRLEERAFDVDRISRRAWRHLLSRAHGQVLVTSPSSAGPILGAAVVLFRTGSSVARLYSLAVDPDARGSGLGRRLLADALQSAREAGCETLRLEVREDNRSALQLYRAEGFREIGRRADYYADGAPALRMERLL